MVCTGLNYVTVPAATTSEAGHTMTDMFVLKENIFAWFYLLVSDVLFLGMEEHHYRHHLGVSCWQMDVFHYCQDCRFSSGRVLVHSVGVRFPTSIPLGLFTALGSWIVVAKKWWLVWISWWTGISVLCAGFSWLLQPWSTTMASTRLA